jgi:hypothetical protein
MEDVKLWRAGLRLFNENVQEWLKWSISFVFLWIPVNVLVVRYGQAMANVAKENPHNMKADIAAPFLYVALIMMVLGLVQYYIFAAFFFGKKPLLGMPEFSLRTFGYTFWKTFQVGLVILGVVTGVGIALGVLIALMTAVHAIPRTSGMATLLPMAVSAILSCAGGLYLGIRLTLTKALAVNRVQTPLKMSWHLSYGNVGRLLGNLFVVMSIVWLPLWLLTWAIAFGMKRGGIPGDDQAIVNAVLTSITQTIVPGVLTSFNCVACCVLYQEKKESDPAFALTMLT